MMVSSWVRQKMFQVIHGHNLVYNQCWEDPRLDRIALEIKPSDQLLVLTSAGCNVLDYLLDDPLSIDAVDLNPRQNALLELKKAGIKCLEYDDFYLLFGHGLHFGAEKIYQQTLRKELPDFAQAFWDKNIDYFLPSTLNKGFYYHGTSGWVARILSEYISLKGLRGSIENVFESENLEQQSQIYFNELKPHFWNAFLRWFTRRGATMSALGVPRSQFIQIEYDYVGGMAQFIEDCLDAVFSRLSLSDNYFYRLYLFGSYRPDCSPEYLKENNFNILKSRVDRIQTHNSSVLDFLTNTKKTIHKATLLDHMDWLYQNHYDILKEQWQKLIDRSQEGSRIIWRSASSKVSFVDPITLKDGRTLGRLLNYNPLLSNELHRLDRVHTYGSFSIAQVGSL